MKGVKPVDGGFIVYHFDEKRTLRSLGRKDLVLVEGERIAAEDLLPLCRTELGIGALVLPEEHTGNEQQDDLIYHRALFTQAARYACVVGASHFLLYDANHPEQPPLSAASVDGRMHVVGKVMLYNRRV